MLAEYNMSALLSADQVIVGLHILVYIPVAYCCFFIVDSGCIQRFVQSEITHNRCYNSIARQLTFAFQILGADVHDLVAVHLVAVLIHRKAPVRVSVKSKTNIQFVLFHVFLQ